ncbi:hypothetical protein [Fulvivirga sedimenti]|uniref:TonB C-terminal domain-containing protein n=1 Tax=Fulvivirga sedimenti TaxID=2879465 RepID=A0A9X1HUT7_9BACT|nr:hypothetical protein [Fulvivirga sedimenti]MCA6078714.1 hypothetical protein [Fulvivirga sedimenti]
MVKKLPILSPQTSQEFYYFAQRRLNMRYALAVLLLFLISIQLSHSQIRYDNKNYPDNHIDEDGRRQGTWFIYDINDKLVNKINYRNNVPDSVVYYYNLDGIEILIQKVDSSPTLVYRDQDLDPLKDNKFWIETLDCGYSVIFLINKTGSPQEIRLVSNCSKKVNKRLLAYARSFQFEPAKLSNKSIVSLYTFGVRMAN